MQDEFRATDMLLLDSCVKSAKEAFGSPQAVAWVLLAVWLAGVSSLVLYVPESTCEVMRSLMPLVSTDAL